MPPEKLSGNLQGARPYLQNLHDLANQAGMSVAQLAFSYVRDMEAVSSIVFGADNREQIQQNIALMRGASLDISIRQAIENEFQQVPESVITPALWTF